MLWDILTAHIIWPWNNLGCLGFSGRTFYADIFRKPYFGLFVTVYGKEPRWYKLPSLH